MSWQLDPPEASRIAGALPDSVRMRDEVVFGTRERLVAPATHPGGRTDEGGGSHPWESRFVLNRWWMEGAALRVRFSDGEGDTWQVRLVVDSDGLRGRARYEGDRDAGGAAPSADVRANRIDCEYQ